MLQTTGLHLFAKSGVCYTVQKSLPPLAHTPASHASYIAGNYLITKYCSCAVFRRVQAGRAVRCDQLQQLCLS